MLHGEITRTLKDINKHGTDRKDETLTDTGYEVMEDFLREEGLVEPSEVELQDAGNGVHVVVILVPCQRVLTYTQRRSRKREGKDYKVLDELIKMLMFPAGWLACLSQTHSWCRWLPPESLTLWRCPHAADLHRHEHTKNRCYIKIRSPFTFSRFNVPEIWHILCLKQWYCSKIPNFKSYPGQIKLDTNNATNQCTGKADAPLESFAHHADWWSGCSSRPSEEWLHRSPETGGEEITPDRGRQGRRLVWKITHTAHFLSGRFLHTCLHTHMHRCTHLCVRVCVWVCVWGGCSSTQLLLGDGAFSFSLCLFGVSRKSLGGEGCGGHVGLSTVCTHC